MTITVCTSSGAVVGGADRATWRTVAGPAVAGAVAGAVVAVVTGASATSTGASRDVSTLAYATTEVDGRISSAAAAVAMPAGATRTATRAAACRYGCSIS